ncbi:MAG: hypothetical protein EOO91_02235 [Pedobacter sp.]|nr:MAG: hypothetical protein EOO91_02235 [Pedobacter sp.]
MGFIKYKLKIKGKEVIATSTGTGYKFDGARVAMTLNNQSYDEPFWDGSESDNNFYMEVAPYLIEVLQVEKEAFMAKLKMASSEIESIEEIDASHIEIVIKDTADLNQVYNKIRNAAELNKTFNTNLQIVIQYKNEEYEIQLNGFIAKFQIPSLGSIDYKVIYNNGYFIIYENGMDKGLYAEETFYRFAEEEPDKSIKENYLKLYNHYHDK